jgi:hypothetical protein
MQECVTTEDRIADRNGMLCKIQVDISFDEYVLFVSMLFSTHG